MTKTEVAAIVAGLILAGCQSSANMQWTQIGPGPTLEYAEAQCNIGAMGVERGVVAWGSPSYVAGAQLGNAIGNAIRQAEFKKNCMVLQGWKQVPTSPNRTHAIVTAGPITPPNPDIASNLAAFGSANNRCIAGDNGACANRDKYRVTLVKLGVNPG